MNKFRRAAILIINAVRKTEDPVEWDSLRGCNITTSAPIVALIEEQLEGFAGTAVAEYELERLKEPE